MNDFEIWVKNDYFYKELLKLVWMAFILIGLWIYCVYSCPL